MRRTTTSTSVRATSSPRSSSVARRAPWTSAASRRCGARRSSRPSSRPGLPSWQARRPDTMVRVMTTLTADWSQELDRRREGMVALRRDFHRHPELSFEETRTAGIIADRLHAAKLDVRSGVGRTGVVGVLRGERPGRTIAWRADIDALPLIESLAAPFVSGTRGVMHACGHDGHTAIAVTLAEILAARRAHMAGTAVFIFQPAEEVFGGAEPMIA